MIKGDRMRGSRLVWLFGAIACLAIAGLLAPSRTSAQLLTTVTVDFNTTASDPCGGPLLCDGQNWTWPADASTWAGGVRTFLDPLPPGSRIARVSARAIGECTGRATELHVAGDLLGSVSYSGGGCICDNNIGCEISNTVTRAYAADPVGYVRGGLNTVALGPGNPNFVIVAVEIDLYYWDGCVGGAPNGVLEPGEICDDGAESASCDADCTAALCGDGTTNATAGELCDDGGESASCDVDCTAPVCGDGLTNATAGETCDDGGESASCDADCTEALCGDGQTNATAGEACDDGNSDDGDACLSTCVSATCGDGVVQVGLEVCDEGAANSDTAPDACRLSCLPARCGDGVADTGEDCDDSDLNSDTTPDACRLDCSAPRCGDGVIDRDEECDGEASCGLDCALLASAMDAGLAPDGALDAGISPPSEGGCGCRIGAATAPNGGSSALLGLLLAGGVLLRRQRRTRRRS
ncbi:MAG: MYXO-CTERM sorting domain-containing protein [Myxococcales bacterium]|nr:MYXO-CTERM sorting domain-containing protein [Myxococcales bacterium]